MQNILRRARADTLAAFGFRWSTLWRTIPVAVVVVLLLYFLRGGGEAMNEAMEIALYVVAFFLAAIVPTFLWNLWLAPYKILGENISSLRQEITVFRKAFEKRSEIAQEGLDLKAEEGAPLCDNDVWLVSPGAGRIAARLIMTVPSLEEAQRIYDGYRAAPNREHEESANYAFLHRLNLEGHGAEVYALAEELTDKHEEINMDGEIEKELTRLYEDARKERGT